MKLCPAPAFETAVPGELWIVGRPCPLAEALAQRCRDQGQWTRLLEPNLLPESTIPLAGLVLFAPRDPTAADAWRALSVVQKLAHQLRSQKKTAVLAFVARHNGSFAFESPASGHSPVQAAWWGLGKTVAREWPEVRVRVVDVDPNLDDFAAAEALAAELEKHQPLEVALRSHGRFGVELEPVAHRTSSGRFQSDDFFLVSGGARGVTAAAARAIARHGVRRLLLLGRTILAEPEPPALARLLDEVEIKRWLMDHGPPVQSPRALKAACERVLAGRELHNNLDLLRREGVEVEYRACDITDAAAVRAAVNLAVEASGPITGLIHGAGVLADRKLEQLSQADFAAVFEPKVAGFANLWNALDLRQLRHVVLFSSITARVGRPGQAAYAMANEVLNKQAAQLRQKHPHLRVQAINWGPWDGGMVQGGLKELFHREGVGLIPQHAGAELLVQELLATEPRPTELVVSAPGTEPQTSASRMAVTVASQPLLNDHRLAGQAVVPFALALSWLARQASVLMPKREVLAIRDAQVLKGMVLDPVNGLDLHLRCQAGERLVTGEVVAECGQRHPLRHLRAQFSFGSASPPEQLRAFTSTHVGGIGDAADYQNELFHGPAWRFLRRIEMLPAQGLKAWAVCRHKEDWHGISPWVWWLDAAFQTVIVWTQRSRNLPSLPGRFESLDFLASPIELSEVQVDVRVREVSGPRVTTDVIISADNERILARLTGCEHLMSESLKTAFEQQQPLVARD